MRPKIIDDKGRTCSKCTRYQTWGNYHTNTRGYCGRRSECKWCEAERKRLKRLADKNQ